jgi:hypothetical protein
MLPTPQLRTDLRELVEEVIAPGQADTDTRFTDAVIDAILTASDHINQAAATAWQRKAAKALDERGGLQDCYPKGFPGTLHGHGRNLRTESTRERQPPAGNRLPLPAGGGINAPYQSAASIKGRHPVSN